MNICCILSTNNLNLKVTTNPKIDIRNLIFASFIQRPYLNDPISFSFISILTQIALIFI